MKKLLIPFAIILIALTGCTSTASTEASGPKKASAPASSEPAEPPATYSTVEELRDAFIATGELCEWNAETHLDDGVALAAQSGYCYAEARLSIYLSDSDKTATVARLKEGFFRGALVGENWIIETPDPVALSKILGGTVVTS